VVSLARHPCGSAVLEAAYVLGNATQRSALVAEFYGPEFSLKAHAAVVLGAWPLLHTAKGRVAKRAVSDSGWEIAHAAVSRRPPISFSRVVAHPEGYTHDANVCDL
jgi:hypothetical protein